MDVFARRGSWPALRRAAVEFQSPAFAGDVLRFETTLTQHGRTSFSLHQTARRADDHQLVADGDFVFVCVDESDRPTAVPDEVGAFLGMRPSVRSGGTRHITVRGLSIAVDVQGDGPAILFIHGFPLDRTMWRYLVAPLTGWRRIAPDLRGMGLSDAPAHGYSMREYVEDQVALLDALGVERAVVCGLSMGGYVAFELMRRHADRVRALVLANTRAAADTLDARRRRDELIQLVEREGAGALADAMIETLLAPSSLAAMPQVVRHLRTMIAGSSKEGVIGALRAMQERADATPLLPTLAVPTLVVAGREDRLVPPEEAKLMADAIPEAQFTAIAEAGHLAPIEQPIAMSRVLGEFLEAVA